VELNRPHPIFNQSLSITDISASIFTCGFFRKWSNEAYSKLISYVLYSNDDIMIWEKFSTSVKRCVEREKHNRENIGATVDSQVELVA